VEHLDPIGEDEGRVDEGRCLVHHPRQRREDDRARLPLDHLKDRRALDPVLRQQPLEGGGLGNAEPDPKPEPDHDDAEDVLAMMARRNWIRWVESESGLGKTSATVMARHPYVARDP
jgi:hypothetical protein